jgi:Zn-finger nucleic acid-binding protein
MKCPRDNSTLKLEQSEQVVGQVCNICKGIFLEGKGVDAFKYNHETQILDQIYKIVPQVKSDIICPCCKSSMKIISLDNLEIDICKKCKGMWFDESEISKIITKHSPHNTSDENAFTFSILLEVLGNIVAAIL